MTERRANQVMCVAFSSCMTVLAGACGEVSGGGVEGEGEKKDTVLSRGNEASEGIADLARDYVFKEVDAEGTKEIRERIRSLEPEEAIHFHEEVAQMNNLTGRERILFDAAFEYARSRGVLVQDLRDAEHGEDLRKLFVERVRQSIYAGESGP